MKEDINKYICDYGGGICYRKGTQCMPCSVKSAWNPGTKKLEYG